MTKKEMVKSSVLAGVGILISFESLFQDFLGQEGYMRLVRDHWVSWVYSVPLALILLFVSILDLAKCLKTDPTS